MHYHDAQAVGVAPGKFYLADPSRTKLQPLGVSLPAGVSAVSYEFVLGGEAFVIILQSDGVLLVFDVRKSAKPDGGRKESRDLETHGLECGDWLAYRTEHEGILRYQFLLQPPGSHELLFVNREGHRVLTAPVGQMLVSGHAVFFQPALGFDNRLERIVQGQRRPLRDVDRL